MTVTVVFEITARPEHRDALVKFMHENLGDTRAWKGCRHVDYLIEQDDPNHIVVWQHWDSRAQYEEYFKWRREGGSVASISPWVTGPPTVRYYDSAREWT